MKYVLIVLIAVSSFSCNERVIHLPETNSKAITEILDVSPAYVFYNEEKDSAEFNRKNLISTTNWLVNVDKRLSLKQAMPHIIYLQDKRKKASMHKNEKARNYFSCSNPDIQNLAFIDFTDVDYSEDFTKSMDSTKSNFELIIRNLDDMEMISQGNNGKNTSMVDLQENVNQMIKTINPEEVEIQLKFRSDLTFSRIHQC